MKFEIGPCRIEAVYREHNIDMHTSMYTHTHTHTHTHTNIYIYYEHYICHPDMIFAVDGAFKTNDL